MRESYVRRLPRFNVLHSLKRTASESPWKIGHPTPQKETIIFQPSISRCELLVSGRIAWIVFPSVWFSWSLYDKIFSSILLYLSKSVGFSPNPWHDKVQKGPTRPKSQKALSVDFQNWRQNQWQNGQWRCISYWTQGCSVAMFIKQ